MKIIVSDIPEEGMDVSFAQGVLVDEGRESRVEASMRVEKFESEIIVRGTIDADMPLACSRCLKEFTAHVRIPVDMACEQQSVGEDGEPEGDMPEDDIDTCVVRDGEIDLGELVREQVILAGPMKPLCGESCKGLCPSCGQDLNEGPCGCPAKAADPRFQALGKLLTKKEGEK